MCVSATLQAVIVECVSSDLVQSRSTVQNLDVVQFWTDSPQNSSWTQTFLASCGHAPWTSAAWCTFIVTNLACMHEDV